MKTVWVKGLSKTEGEEVRSLFSSNSRFRERAIKLMRDKAESIRVRNTVENAYDNPNWALKQADAVGYERALNEMISLFTT